MNIEFIEFIDCIYPLFSLFLYINIEKKVTMLQIYNNTNNTNVFLCNILCNILCNNKKECYKSFL